MLQISTTCIIFLLILHVATCSAWFPFTSLECDPGQEAPTANSNKTEEDDETPTQNLPDIDNHLANECCAIPCTKFISPYQEAVQRMDRNVMPICLKCAICLAIAEKVQLIFEDLIDGNDEFESPASERECVEEGLKTLCATGFKNHELREYNGYSMVTEISASTNHIKSQYDGQWTRMLRKMCTDFLAHLDNYALYDMSKRQRVNVTDYMCHGDGIFRECNNIQFNTVLLPETEENKLKFWVSCWFD